MSRLSFCKYENDRMSNGNSKAGIYSVADLVGVDQDPDPDPDQHFKTNAGSDMISTNKVLNFFFLI